MKYLKRYTENIDWEFDEEEINKISDKTFYIYLFGYSDEYSHALSNGTFRIFIGFLGVDNKNYIIDDIIDNEIHYKKFSVSSFKKRYEYKLINEIKKGDFWITTCYANKTDKFKKWKFSELDSLLDISEEIIFVEKY